MIPKKVESRTKGPQNLHRQGTRRLNNEVSEEIDDDSQKSGEQKHWRSVMKSIRESPARQGIWGLEEKSVQSEASEARR
eukprot:CAMPEP_0172652456 /NCGR_PEP_ID=MMETSP1068-20121228/243326_1 /TAXON_ID=35684 /ORGANISM="Pseudopedinella elastica, Strain CCMP716" /LENGTH=78 /DNA_ID=CAMNT_0013466863 /DNA_START=465 /DNA_END=701 /DNA_ORIENTATION=+